MLILAVTYKDALEALSDPTRLTLFQQLRKGPRTVAELASTVPVSQPAVSQHLRRLREARLVERRADGPRRIYRLNPEGLSELRAFVEELWDDVLAAYGKLPRRPLEEERK